MQLWLSKSNSVWL